MLHRTFIVSLLTIGGILLGMAPASAQQSLNIVGPGGPPIAGLGSAIVDVNMTNTDPVQGFVLAIAYDNSVIEITGVVAGAVVAPAELYFPEILATGLTVGMVMDSGPPFGGQTIAAGTDQTITLITAKSIILVNELDPDVTTNLTFLDGTLNSPPLDNILVQGGLSIGVGAGLVLDSTLGSLTITAPPPDSFTIENVSVPADGSSEGCARIIMNNQSGPVQGFVIAIAHDSGVVTLEDINLDGTVTETELPEFVAPSILANGGTLGVVLDFGTPFAGQTIAEAVDNHIANFCYSCVTPIIYFTGQTPPPAQTTDLLFANGQFGTPPLNNVIVVTGLSLAPDLVDGILTCEPVEQLLEDTCFYCGPRSYEGTIDPDNNPAPPIEGVPGTDVEVCFFYKDSSDNLQGLQLAICYDCDLTFLSFDLTDSIFDEVGAEFVSFAIDDDPNDGDGCEFVAGILLDALPPFDGQSVPPTEVPLLIGCATVAIDATAACGSTLAIEFCDFINADGNVDIENIAIIDFQSIQGFNKVDCAVLVVPAEIFQRGDCNSDDKVDLADAAKVLGWQFQGQPIDCPDACDSNDDGKINLADSVLLMNYLFLAGQAPPAPGPIDDGTDPTADALGECMSNDSTCP